MLLRAHESIRARQDLSQKKPSPRYEFLQAKNGMPVAKRDGVFLDSGYDPEAAASARALRMEIRGKRAAVVFGDGFCYLARELARKGLRVLVVESDAELLIHALDILGDGAFCDFYLVFAEEDFQDAVFADFIEPSWQINDVLIVSAPAAAAPVLRQAEAALVALFKRRMLSLETGAWFGERWAFNILDNLISLTRYEVSAQWARYEAGAGRAQAITLHRGDWVIAAPGPSLDSAAQRDSGGSRAQAITLHRGDWVIAAPGPSLDSAASLLGRERERYTLLALAPALRPLLDRGITPDLVASSDGGWANGLHLAGLYPAIPLLFPLFCFGGIARAWRGPLIPFSYGSAFESLFFSADGIPVLAETPTVALFALQLAVRFGAERIVFAGQDFAALSSKGHARGYRFDTDACNRSARSEPPEKYLDGTYRRRDKSIAGWRSEAKMLLYSQAFAREIQGLPIKLSALDASPFLTAIPPAGPFEGRGERSVFTPPACRIAPGRLEGLLEFCSRALRGEAPLEGEALGRAAFADPALGAFFALARPIAQYHHQRGDYLRAGEMLSVRLPVLLQRLVKRLCILLNTQA